MVTKTRIIQWEEEPPVFNSGKCTSEGYCVLQTENVELTASPAYMSHRKKDRIYQLTFKDKRSKRVESAIYDAETGLASYVVSKEGVDGVDPVAKPKNLLGYSDISQIPGLPIELRTGIESLFEALEEKVSPISLN